jgi:hypothetical protein
MVFPAAMRNPGCHRPLTSLCLYAGPGRTLNSSQVCVTARTHTTGNCTFVVSLLFQINHTFFWLLICLLILEANNLEVFRASNLYCCTLNIINELAKFGFRINLEKSANLDKFRPTLTRWRYEVSKTSILLDLRFIPPYKNSSPIGWF